LQTDCILSQPVGSLRCGFRVWESMRLWAAFEATWAAERAGRLFSRLPVAPEAQLAVVLRDSDMMHARLANEQEEDRT
jgi:hypothetical protein